MRYTKATIDLAAIKHNIKTVQTLTPTADIVAVVKANGYGHGAVEIAKTALKVGCSHLAVALPSEGVVLRKASINAPIWVLGLTTQQEASCCVENDFIVTICDIDHLQPLITACEELHKTVKVMLKIDTGMNRIGAKFENALDIAKAIEQIDCIELLGAFTHFASAGGDDLTYAQKQLASFKQIISHLEENQVKLPFVSAAASSAIFNLPDSHFNLVRLGIAMYGLYPSPQIQKKHTLKPALHLTSNISYIKKVPANSPIGYEMTYYTKEDNYIATLPLGYADGYSRLFSNKAHVLIKDKLYPVVGNICMDQLMVDLGSDSNVKVGDQVVLVGHQNGTAITLEELAPLAHTINYELACNISLRVPRIYEN